LLRFEGSLTSFENASEEFLAEVHMICCVFSLPLHGGKGVEKELGDGGERERRRSGMVYSQCCGRM